ncbi:hypothetical protein SteCoe_36765 [Stentor coeruleus]|uniref:Uncharacterized protein n=1 Tax=Stentor coeruleus TaxID=5963 RepID=A0A1R2APG3_9CILI|nr:hypothetical protein SteCoe_36765 [Stentor coeruleus]
MATLEELQNLRSDSEILEKKIVAPTLINIIKILTKASIGILALLSFIYGTSCGNEMNDVLEGSFIILFFESTWLSFFVIVKAKSNNCQKVASYIGIAHMIIDFSFDAFYIGWGIYVTVIYFNENTCGKKNFTDILALVVIIYFLLALSLMTCCCGAKLCICLSTVMASVKTNVDRSMSQDLIIARSQSFAESNP